MKRRLSVIKVVSKCSLFRYYETALAVGGNLFFSFPPSAEIATAINCLAMTEKKERHGGDFHTPTEFSMTEKKVGKEFLFHFDATLTTEKKVGKVSVSRQFIARFFYERLYRRH